MESARCGSMFTLVEWVEVLLAVESFCGVLSVDLGEWVCCRVRSSGSQRALIHGSTTISRLREGGREGGKSEQ